MTTRPKTIRSLSIVDIDLCSAQAALDGLTFSLFGVLKPDRKQRISLNAKIKRVEALRTEKLGLQVIDLTKTIARLSNCESENFVRYVAAMNLEHITSEGIAVALIDEARSILSQIDAARKETNNV